MCNRIGGLALLLPVILFQLAGISRGSPIVSVSSDSVPTGSFTTISITVTDSALASDEDIEGLDFAFQIGGGFGSTPFVTNVDLLTGTVWAGHVSPENIIVNAGGNEPQFQVRSLIIDFDKTYINPNGLLASVTISTAGAATGDYPLLVTGTIDSGSDTALLSGIDGNPVPATFFAGVLHVTAAPEPACSMLLIGAIGLLHHRARR